MAILKTIEAKLLAFIIIITFLLKLYQLSSPPLFGDELDVGNQAFSLATTLKDYRGQLLPFYLNSFSESRAPLLIYFTIPFIKIFGLTPLAVRLPSLLFSSLSLIFFYLLVKKAQKSAPALLATAIMAISPIFFHYSRLAFESQLLLFLLLSATYYYLSQKYLLSFFLFVLSFYTYNTANIFVPLLAIFLFVSSFNKIVDLKKYFLKLALISLLLLPLLFRILSGSASNRFSLISIFNQNHQAAVEVKRSTYSNPYALSERIFHNRPLEIIKAFSSNYLDSLSLNTLFLKADPNPRHSIPGFGFFLLPSILFLLALPFSTIRPSGLFLFWLVISPVASSLTQDGGQHATRLFIVLPAISYLLALGAYRLYQFFKFIFFILLSIILFSFFNFYHELHHHYPKDQFQSWGYGYQQLFENLPQSQRIFISNTDYNLLSPYIFYQKIKPQLLQDQSFSDQSQDKLIENYSGFFLTPKTYFITNWQGDTLEQIKTNAQTGDLYVLKQIKDIPGDMNLSTLQSFRLINQVRDPHQNLLYQVILKQ